MIKFSFQGLFSRSESSFSNRRVEAIFLAFSVVEPDPRTLAALETNEGHWEAAARLSVARRTYPLFLKNLNAFGLTKKVSSQFLVTLRDLSDRSAAYTARLLKFSERLFAALTVSGVSAIPLKGVSVARYYPEPFLRPMVDIDILIEPEDFSKCRAVLEDLGFYIADPVHNGVLINSGQECLFRNHHGFQVDVHYRLFPWYEEEMIYRIASSDLMRRAVPENKGSMTIRRLLPEDELYYLLLSLHRSRGGCYWHWIDIQAMKDYFGTALRIERVSALIKKSPLEKELMSLAVRAGLWDEPHVSTRKIVFFEETRSRLRDKIFLWRRIKNPLDRMKLLGVYAKWHAFKSGGFFKREFLNVHNPTGEEIDCRWRIEGERMVIHEIDEKRVLVDLKSGELFDIDGPGGLIWDDLASGKDLQSIVCHLAEDYEVNIRTARKDVQFFLRQLKEAGLIVH